jgi:hypothetical protein
MTYYLTLLRLREIASIRPIQIICKGKRYIRRGQKPPKGVTLHRGPNDGIYYLEEELRAMIRKKPEEKMHHVFPLPVSKVKEILRYALPIRHQDYETLFILDPDKDVIVHQRDGTNDEISMEGLTPDIVKNKRLLHNHPTGNSFSLKDLDFAFRNSIKESWVIGKDGVIFLMLPPSGQMFFDLSELNDTVNRAKSLERDILRDVAWIVNAHRTPEMYAWGSIETRKRIMNELHNEGLIRYYEIPIHRV